ncbi:MAG: Rieske (2Fe-2S) protein, partial [Candidatus Eremiobacteraeota bacterium]|nr:Rieske (2Fe-2S) protein [Candidatus Eremiobacteraeota bacterium]
MKAVKSKLEVTLPKRFYFSEDIYAQEKERIFWREWFCAGREEQVANAGDYLVLDVAGESVLVVRGKDGALRAFYNVCRHRGSRLMPAPEDKPGSQESLEPGGRLASGIRCPYHAWTYALDGGLRTAPFLTEENEFFKDEFALYPVALETWGGFFFLHLTPG